MSTSRDDEGLSIRASQLLEAARAAHSREQNELAFSLLCESVQAARADDDRGTAAHAMLGLVRLSSACLPPGEEDLLEYRERLCVEALREFEALEDLEGIASATQLLAREKPVHEARSMLERSVRIMRQIGNQAGLMRCLDSLATFICIGGDREACQAMKREALAIARASDDLENTAYMLYSLGITEEGVGAQRAAMFEEAASIFATLGHAFDEGRCLAYCATLACQEDEAPKKESLLRQALELFAKTGKNAMMSYCYDALAELARERNDHESAATLESASRTAWPTGEHLEGVNPCPSELNYETLRDAMRRLCTALGSDRD